jgi:hypothetical protein
MSHMRTWTWCPNCGHYLFEYGVTAFCIRRVNRRPFNETDRPLLCLEMAEGNTGRTKQRLVRGQSQELLCLTVINTQSTMLARTNRPSLLISLHAYVSFGRGRTLGLEGFFYAVHLISQEYARIVSVSFYTFYCSLFGRHNYRTVQG